MQENWISACVKDSHLEGMHLLYSQSEKNMLLLQTKYKKYMNLIQHYLDCICMNWFLFMQHHLKTFQNSMIKNAKIALEQFYLMLCHFNNSNLYHI